MLNLPKLLLGRLGGSDGHPSVDLPGVGRQDRRMVVFGKSDAEVGFSRSGRPHDDDESFFIRRRSCHLPRNR